MSYIGSKSQMSYATKRRMSYDYTTGGNPWWNKNEICDSEWQPMQLTSRAKEGALEAAPEAEGGRRAGAEAAEAEATGVSAPEVPRSAK